MSSPIRLSISAVCFILFAFQLVFAQDSTQVSGVSKSSQYLLGDEERLEMLVYIWGEVRSPGEYRIPFNTNVVELISIAGGPVRSAKLDNVQITRQASQWSVNSEKIENIIESAQEPMTEDMLKRSLQTASRKILFYNVDKYLGDEDMVIPPPILKPGDVVNVSTNNWYWWREMIKVLHEVAVIASVYAWFLRSKI
ncbi:MAG: hypothetical protein EHM72_03395 [Calditrichaeota bacterium]|nr:MAG: hypothetical protein EHM72_03395 [Calditrichota bacterium]